MAVVSVSCVVVLFLPEHSPRNLAFTVDGILSFVMPLPQAFCPLLFLLLGERHRGRGRSCPVACISPTKFTPTFRFVIGDTTWGHLLRGAGHCLLIFLLIFLWIPGYSVTPTLLLFWTLHFPRGGGSSPFLQSGWSLDPSFSVASFFLLSLSILPSL